LEQWHNMDARLIVTFSLFGLIYGVVLNRSGFCFSQAAFELFYLRSRETVNGIMLGLLAATLGFGVVAAVRQHAGLSIAPHLLSLPAGVGAIVGGALFGLGMTIAGMCAVGTLQRAGEGYCVAWIVLTGILLGAAAYPFQALLSGLTARAEPLSLEDWVGPLPGFGITLLALATIWVALLRTSGRAGESGPTSLFRRASLSAPAVIGGAALGLLNTAQMSVSVPWTAGYPLAALPSVVRSSPEVPLATVAGPLALNAGLVLGAALSSLHQKEFRLTWPRSRRDLLSALLGGVLMGWGIRAAHACNIGGLFSAIPSLAISGWFYLAGLLPGAWLGTKVVARLR
jgi:uncharacterized membrane protein YedE/YeeE